MKFWDSSALVPLVVEETRSKMCRSLRRHDRSVVVWALTRLEIVSALRRLTREGFLNSRQVVTATRRLDVLARSWHEIEPVPAVLDRAERLVAVHPLAAADALQLAAALVLVDDRPRHRELVTADARLADAAEAEGFAVIVPQST